MVLTLISFRESLLGWGFVVTGIAAMITGMGLYSNWYCSYDYLLIIINSY